jgi:hypothetical protein
VTLSAIVVWVIAYVWIGLRVMRVDYQHRVDDAREHGLLSPVEPETSVALLWPLAVLMAGIAGAVRMAHIYARRGVDDE